MIIPVGHEETELSGVPWVCFGTIGLCTAIFLGQFLYFKSQPNQLGNLEQAFEFWHPRKEYLDVPKDLESLLVRVAGDVTVQELADSRADWGVPSGSELEDQEIFDEYVAEIVGKNEYLWVQKWGYVPANSNLGGLIGHMFLHGGFWHLFGNMLFLYLAGSVLEDRYGSLFYGVFYLVGGFFACLMYALPTPDSAVPLIGASGAISAVLGGFLIKYWRTKIRLLLWFFWIFQKIVSVPAWVVLPFWFCLQLLSASVAGEGSGVAYTAHIWGFVFGAAICLLLQVTKIEARLWPPIHDETNGLQQVQAALKLEAFGKHEQAFNTFKAESEKPGANMNVVENYWRLAKDLGHRQDMKKSGQQLITMELDGGDASFAFVRFKAISDALGFVKLNSQLTTRLIRELKQAGCVSEADEVRDYFPTCVPDLKNGNKRGPTPTVSSPLGNELSAPSPSTSSFAKTPSLVEPLVAVSELKQVENLKAVTAIPKKLSRVGMVLSVNERTKEITYDRIKAIAVGVIRQPGKKPVLLIDLVFDDLFTWAPQHRVFRLLSHQYDPRQFFSGIDKSNVAFQRLIKVLLRGSGALAEPSVAAVSGNPYANYQSIGEFEETIYHGQEAKQSNSSW